VIKEEKIINKNQMEESREKLEEEIEKAKLSFSIDNRCLTIVVLPLPEGAEKIISLFILGVRCQGLGVSDLPSFFNFPIGAQFYFFRQIPHSLGLPMF